MKLALLLLLAIGLPLSALFAFLLYRTIRRACAPDLDPYLDSLPPPAPRSAGCQPAVSQVANLPLTHTDIIWCRECSSPRFANAPCWHCSNQADAARLSSARASAPISNH